MSIRRRVVVQGRNDVIRIPACVVIHETDKSYLITDDQTFMGELNKWWVPKSKTIIEDDDVLLPRWMAERCNIPDKYLDGYETVFAERPKQPKAKTRRRRIRK